jgi:uroporphyrinogen-III decarboxylase
MDLLLPLLKEIGFDAIHPVWSDQEALLQVKRQAQDLTLIGGIPISLLTHGTREEIEEAVAGCCARLGSEGNYILSSSTGIIGEIPPHNLVTMTQAVQKYGRYDLSARPHFQRVNG